jgi:LuxR family transcriptional regulator, maltose regulon positive regulatory protein
MAVRPDGGRAGGLPVEILESKLYQPAVRPGVVPRPRLVARLVAGRQVPTVAIVAPAGYGKTTLLALWAEADDRAFAWLSLDAHDNDPIVLLTHLALALDRVSPLPTGAFDALRSPGVSVPATVVPRLGAALASFPQPLVLVVDDVHHLRDGASLDALVTLVGHVRGTTQMALAGREMPLSLARQRAQGRTLEIGVPDLAFTADGARSLLHAAGADLPMAEAGRLARRTEGWAAGLYLAALASTASGTTAAAAVDGTGDRLAADFLQSELLSRLPPADLSFLTRTAVLDRLSGPLCDEVLERSGSAGELDRLARKNLFLVPLGGRGQWYRYHQLFRDLLRAHVDEGTRRALLRRAAGWFETDGQLEVALQHAQEAEDVDRVARLTTALAQPMYTTGRSTTLMDWFDWIDRRGAVERHPAIAAQAAYVCALTGRPAAADRWADLAERCSGLRSPAAGEGPFAMWLTTTRAMMCRSGVEDMQRLLTEGAQRVPGAGSGQDIEYPMRMFLIGVSHLLAGDDAAAEARFTDASELTEEAQRSPFLSVTLAHRALVALRRGDWSSAEALVDGALAVVRRRHTESFISSLLVFAVAARVARHRGDLTLAGTRLGEAQRIRPLLSHAIPWYAVEVQVQLAEVSIGLGDPSGAWQFVRDADAVLRRRPDLGCLGKQTDELRGRLDALRPAGDTSTLTAAELRLLPLLVTHLTLADIADRLFLSRHTVKSQVWSMYRKLGAHTRGDAVVRARELGLLGA